MSSSLEAFLEPLSGDESEIDDDVSQGSKSTPYEADDNVSTKLSLEEASSYLEYMKSQIEQLSVYSHAGELALSANKSLMEAFAEDERKRTAKPDFNARSQFEGLAGWSVSALDPSIKIGFIEIISNICVRENSLINMIRLSKALDMVYFKYCIARFRVHHRQHETDKYLQKRLRLLQRTQNEFCVAIAHYRSATIDTLVQIQKYKVMCQKRHGTAGKVTIYWNEVNYILKMTTATEVLMKSQCVKLWLGLTETNTLMIPPDDLNPRSAKSVYALMQTKYHEWHKENKVHKRKFGKEYKSKSYLKLSSSKDLMRDTVNLSEFEKRINSAD